MKSVMPSMKLRLQWTENKRSYTEWFKTNLGPSTEPCDAPWPIIHQNWIRYTDSLIGENCKSADGEIWITD